LLDSLLQEIFIFAMSSVIKGKMPEYAILFQDQETGGGIPFDVTFKIVEANDNTVTEEEEPDKGIKRAKRSTRVKKVKEVKGEIKAHTFILAASSPVFKAMFFGPMKEGLDVIEVKETSFEAFKKLIEYIYHVDIECKDISIVELYDIVNLAERYDMSKLKEELMIQMKNISISMDNVVEVATIANEYSQFEEVSDAVMMLCVNFLQKTINDPADERLEFALTQFARGNGKIALKLLSLVKQLPPLVRCKNCKGKPCIVGQDVPYMNMRQGFKMKMVEYYPFIHDEDYCHAQNTNVTVKTVSLCGQVTVTGFKAGRGWVDHTYNPAWEHNGVLKMTFVYNC